MKSTTKRRHSHWQAHINQWASSAQTQARYCRENNLKQHQFAYWRSKLKADSDTKTSAISTVSAFVPVVVDPHHATGLTLCHPNGFRIEGITATTLGLTQQLLEVLE